MNKDLNLKRAQMRMFFDKMLCHITIYTTSEGNVMHTFVPAKRER